MRRSALDLDEPSRNLQESNGLSSSEDLMDTDVDLSMPPPDDDEALDSDSRIFMPPPRIAARFYRPSTARRKDSAASSRRNSISSAHSRCSSLQHAAHRGPEQSKYIAQHLRRTSFLEDRKARLADRAAHAEKVRLRAALVKATHRDISQSEERALAAQQARERNLAEIVANCAEEVKKAKQVAEFMKEKREQELIKMRAQIEERMAEAERRREELRQKNTNRRSRGQSVMARKPIEVMPRVTEREPRRLTDDEAATHIQGWWRGCLRMKTIKEFNNLGLTVDGIRDTQFDTVVELLAQEKVLLITARLLQTCGLHEGDAGSVEEMAACRTFLSAFLILGHPNQVLANKNDGDNEETDALASHRLPSTDLDNPQLQSLVGKARDLLISFENILARLTSANRYTMPPALKKTLPEAYATFYNAFIAWKSRDSNALIEVMLMQFVELDAIFQTVKDTTDDAATALYKQSIRDNQSMLIVRIKRLAGPEKGKKMLLEAVTEARQARRKQKRTGDTKPRVAETGSNEASETAESLVSPNTQTPTPPATPASKTESKRIVKTGLNGLLPDNRVVVHELVINKEYQISAEEYRRQGSELSQPIYMQMRANLDHNDNNANFQFFLVVSGNIKDKLQRLLRPGDSKYKLIDEMFDAEMAARQFAVGSFSYEKFFTAMATLLPMLCAPFRDEELKELVQNKLADGNIIDRVEALNGFIDLMLCDYINYLLRIAAPQLIESATQYEAKRFAEDEGTSSLENAELAWRSARSKVLAEAQKRDPEGINHAKSRPTDGRIYAQMLVDVFTCISPAKAKALPEMLRLDESRFFAISNMVQRIVTCGAILLQCKNLLKRDVRSPWKTEASRIMTVLEAKPPLASSVDGIMAALESGRSMPAATKSHLRALVTKIVKAYQDMWEKGDEPTEPVLRLLCVRLRGNILARLTPGSARDKVKAANNTGERLASLGLSEFVDKVRHISDLLERIGSVDRAAHHPWWEAIASKVAQDEMA